MEKMICMVRRIKPSGISIMSISISFLINVTGPWAIQPLQPHYFGLDKNSTNTERIGNRWANTISKHVSQTNLSLLEPNQCPAENGESARPMVTCSVSSLQNSTLLTYTFSIFSHQYLTLVIYTLASAFISLPHIFPRTTHTNHLNLVNTHARALTRT